MMEKEASLLLQIEWHSYNILSSTLEHRRAVEQHLTEPGSAERQQKQYNSFDFQRKATNHD